MRQVSGPCSGIRPPGSRQAVQQVTKRNWSASSTRTRTAQLGGFCPIVWLAGVAREGALRLRDRFGGLGGSRLRVPSTYGRGRVRAADLSGAALAAPSLRRPAGPGEMSGREEEMDEREGGLAAALDQIRGVHIDEAAVRAGPCDAAGQSAGGELGPGTRGRAGQARRLAAAAGAGAVRP